MKTKTKHTNKANKRASATRRAPSTRRVLNTDEQSRVTNASDDEDIDDKRKEVESTNEVEREEDREVKRRQDNERGEGE